MTKKGGIEICSASTCGAISVFGKESIYVVAFLIFYVVVVADELRDFDGLR